REPGHEARTGDPRQAYIQQGTATSSREEGDRSLEVKKGPIAMSILKHFPGGRSPRPVQEQALRLIEEHWNRSDVIVVTLDVGTGKSFIAETVARWQGKATIVVPSNALLDQ